jgi:hypothetical protein
MRADDAEFKKFINLTHAMAIGGAMTSDDEAETCKEPKEMLSDNTDACMVIDRSERVLQAKSWEHRNAECIACSAQPECQSRVATTCPCHVDKDKVSFLTDTRVGSANTHFNVCYSPNHAAHFALRFLIEWPDLEIVSFQDRDTGKGKALDRNAVCKLQLQLVLFHREHCKHASVFPFLYLYIRLVVTWRAANK